MPNAEIAGQNLVVLQTYSPDTFKNLERKCRSDDGKDKTTKKNMRQFLMDNGLADEVAPGHGSSKPGKGDKPQKGTVDFCKAVAKAL
jgi:hypothetical protein